MNCPKCKNKEFMPNEDFKKPVQQIKTEKFKSITHRRYVCLQCGYKWITVEQFEREVELRTKDVNCNHDFIRTYI